MTLIPIEGVLQTVAKAEAVDADSTKLLCEMALFDVLTELCDLSRSSFESDVDAFISKRADEARRGLVKTYMERRLAGEDVGDVLQAASEVTLLEVSKASKDNPGTPWWDARDMTGRFTRAGEAGTKALKTSDREGYVDPIRADRYAALRETGTALSDIGGPTGSALGGMATAAGSFGPEAERVLGRSLKRVAYRYRGTERTADRNVTSQVKNARKLIDAQIAAQSGDEAAEARLATLYQGFSRTKAQTFDGQRRVNPGQEPFMAIARHWGGPAGKGFSEDQARLAVQGDIAAEYLRGKLPTPRQAAISMAAGRTPPSVGLLIDADGDVVSEAQGFNGDHFLPFDLKNLKRMQGGQYVRTRAMGGPTVEDIYTGLMTGARQMQVVSNSGVFTIEFDPTIRGGRRYSDKATQMIRRYEALLGTIGSGELMQQDVDPERRAELRQEAITEARGNTKRAKEIYNDLLTEERGRQSFAFQEDDELESQAIAEAREELGSGAGRAQIADLAQDKFKFLRQQQKASRVKQFQLDADGYAAAMRSLQEEFPFYIRDVRTETIPEFVRTRGLGDPEKADVPVHNPGADRGHVERGEVNIQAQGVPTDKDSFAGRNGLGRGYSSKDPRSGVGARQRAAEAPVEGTEGATAGGEGTTPAGSTQRASQLPNMKNWNVQPGTLEKDTKPLSKLADFDNPDIATQAKIDFNKLHQAIQDHMLAGNEEIANGAETDEKVVFNHTNSSDVVMWIANNGGFNKLKSLTGENRTKALAHIEKLAKEVPGQSKVVGGDADAKKQIMAAAQGIAKLAAAAEPFGGPYVSGEVLNYDPADDKPRAFEEIIALGNKIKNYDYYKSAARHAALPVADYLEKDAESVKKDIQTLRGLINQVKQDDLKHPDARVERELAAEAAKPGEGPLSAKMKAAHLAWAYHHARSLVPAAPSAPAAGGGGTSTPFGPQAQGVKKADPLWTAAELMEMFRAGPPVEAVRKALGRVG